MKCVMALLPLITLIACENHAFDRDSRQIIAKDEIRKIMAGNRSITITSFREDTLPTWNDSTFKHPIRYTLDFKYSDSTGAEQEKRGVVIFAPQGNAVIRSQIID